MSAEIIASQYNTSIEFFSRGTVARSDYVYPETIHALEKEGFSWDSWESTKLQHEDMVAADVVVAMAQEHKDFVMHRYGVDAYLYNDVVGKRGGIPDVDDVYDVVTQEAREQHCAYVVKYIHETMPIFLDNVVDLHTDLPQAYKQFLKLRTGHHRNDFPFIPICESPSAVAFLSVDVPKGTEGQPLVIPKKRYVSFHSIPKETMCEIMEMVQKIGRVMLEHYDGYNILVNNEACAEQSVFHSHVHVYPRRVEDRFSLQHREKGVVSLDTYVEYSKIWRNRLMYE